MKRPLRVVVDALGVRAGSSSVVVSGLVRGWRTIAPHDELLVVADQPEILDMPHGVRICSLPYRTPAGRVLAQTAGLRAVCREHRADAVLSIAPGSAPAGTPCPRAALVHDLRHVMRPEQFSYPRRVARRATWGRTFRSAGALLCVSERTRGDLIAMAPRLREKAVVVPLGADHVDGWARDEQPSRDYALAFGHFVNKNVVALLQAWARFAPGHPELHLRVVGVPAHERAGIDDLAGRLGIRDNVRVLPWLAANEFQRTFIGARFVVLPSDFEGFGLPAVEAMRLRLPVLVSRDPALAEVTAGHAVVADTTAESLAEGLAACLAVDAAAIDAAHDFARRFTWEASARQTREVLARLSEAD